MKTRKHSSGHEYEISPQTYINTLAGSWDKGNKRRPTLFVGRGFTVIERGAAAQLLKHNRVKP